MAQKPAHEKLWLVVRIEKVHFLVRSDSKEMAEKLVNTGLPAANSQNVLCKSYTTTYDTSLVGLLEGVPCGAPK